MSWTTAYWLTIGLMFGATIGIFLWIRWLRKQPVIRYGYDSDSSADRHT